MQPPPPERDYWLGRLIGGRYRVESRIASGATGTVYLGVQEPIGRRVALKILHPTQDRRAKAEARFMREARMLAQLEHPNTVRVYDVGREGSQAWLAMEHVDGESLQDLLKRGPVGEQGIIRVLVQVCRALTEAHELGVVHRDLKPANILLRPTEGGRTKVKVVDFGLAKTVNDGEPLTAKGLVVGTPMFMSPEQVQGRSDVDPRSDVYSLGILLYRAISGRYPFTHERTADILLAHVSDEPQPFSEDVDVSPCMARVIALCLVKDRDHRMPSTQALGRCLKVVDAVRAGSMTERSGMQAIERLAGRARGSSRSRLFRRYWPVGCLVFIAVTALTGWASYEVVRYVLTTMP
ncbi:MAG: serine/threonine-protein kinase [Myxococcota bacterium]